MTGFSGSARLRRGAAALALMAGLGLANPRPTLAQDDWFGRDKALHFSVSLGLAGAGYGVSASFLDDPPARAAVGASFALLLGASKEIWDARGRGQASWRDLTWDVLGAATGVLFAYLIDRWVHARRATTCEAAP